MAPGDDAELLTRIARGDEDALAALYARHAPQALRYLERLLGPARRSWAEDVLQEAFLRIRRGAATYDPGRSASTWIYTVVHHEAMRLHGRESRRKALPLSEAAGRASPEAGSVGEALEALEGDVRAAVLLVYLQGFTRSEAAAALGRSERQVQDLCREGLQALRKNLKKERIGSPPLG